MRGLHDQAGDAFYDLVTITKGNLEAWANQLPPSEREQALRLRRSVPDGTTIKKTKE